jgi:hypothetical protein
LNATVSSRRSILLLPFAVFNGFGHDEFSEFSCPGCADKEENSVVVVAVIVVVVDIAIDGDVLALVDADLRSAIMIPRMASTLEKLPFPRRLPRTNSFRSNLGTSSNILLVEDDRRGKLDLELHLDVMLSLLSVIRLLEVS